MYIILNPAPKYGVTEPGMFRSVPGLDNLFNYSQKESVYIDYALKKKHY